MMPIAHGLDKVRGKRKHLDMVNVLVMESLRYHIMVLLRSVSRSVCVIPQDDLIVDEECDMRRVLKHAG